MTDAKLGNVTGQNNPNNGGQWQRRCSVAILLLMTLVSAATVWLANAARERAGA